LLDPQTATPTATPTSTATPTNKPTTTPTNEPTTTPTNEPTATPTNKLTTTPTNIPAIPTPIVPAVQLIDTDTGILLQAGQGTLPRNAQLKIGPVTDGTGFVSVRDNLGTANYSLFDISLTSGGAEIQPNGTVEVWVPYPRGFDPDSCYIYRLSADGVLTPMPVRVEGQYIVFQTDHFSLYALADLCFTLGDVNGDGCINIVDILLVRDFIFGIKEPGIVEAKACDFNDCGCIDLSAILGIRDLIFE